MLGNSFKGLSIFVVSQCMPLCIFPALQVLQTSSPSYILLSSLDAARRHATTPTNWSTPLAAEASARRGLVKVSSQCNNCLTLLQRGSCGSEESIEGFDPLRLVVNVQDLGLKGYAAAAWLEEKHGIVSELATSQVTVTRSERLSNLQSSLFAESARL